MARSRIAAASRTAAFEAFARFNQVPFWKVTPLTDGTLVELVDLRFGSPEHPGFEATAVIDATGVAHESQVSFGPLPVKTP